MTGFTAFDRCDRCGAQAYHRLTLRSAKSELLFCNHHWERHEDVLISQGWQLESYPAYEKILAGTPG